MTYGRQQTSGLLFLRIPLFHSHSGREAREGKAQKARLRLFTSRKDDFLHLFWAPLSVHGHISADVWRGPGMLLLCGSCSSCLCNSSALLCLSLRMAFPSAARRPPGAPLYILCLVLCLPENSGVCPRRKWSARTNLSPSLAPLPLPSVSVYLRR